MDDHAGLPTQLAALGEYFALPAPVGTGWRPVAELCTDGAIDEHVERTRTAIARSSGCAVAAISTRVAASSFQLGVAARLLSPTIGSAVCFGVLPVLDAASLMVRKSETHTPQFAVSELRWLPAPDPAVAARLIAETVVAVLVELSTRLHTLVSLPPQVSLGNLTSAANGAVTVLALSHPHHRPVGRALVRELMRIEPLSETGTFDGDQLVRRSCCLFYQVPNGGFCGDCVLTGTTSVQRTTR